MSTTENATETQPAGGSTGAGGGPPPDRHVHGLADVSVVRTDDYRLCHTQLHRAVQLKNIVAVHGPAGLGKTFAVDQFLRQLADSDGGDAPIRQAWVEIPHRPRGKALPVRVLSALYGTTDDSTTADRLQTEAAEGLADQPTVLVIDEAHHLRQDGLFQVKFLYDQANLQGPQVAIVLVGGTSLPRWLAEDEQLESRVAGWAPFQPIEEGELLDVLELYHPIFASTDQTLLLEIDDRACHGSFRTWAHALSFLLHLPGGRPAPTHIDRQLAEAVIDAVGRRRGR